MFKNCSKLNPSFIQSNIDLNKKDEQPKNERKESDSFHSNDDKI